MQSCSREMQRWSTATQCWGLMCTNVMVFVQEDCLSSSSAFRQGWTLCPHFDLSDFRILKMAHSSSTTYSNFLWSLGKSKQNPNCQCSNAATCKTWAQLPKFWFKFEKFGTRKKLDPALIFQIEVEVDCTNAKKLMAMQNKSAKWKVVAQEREGRIYMIL